MSYAGLVARNTAANWIGVAVSTLVLFFLIPYLVRVLGDERFGIYAIANQSLIYVNLLALGMRGTVVRLASRDIAADDLPSLNATLSTISLFYLGAGCLGLVVCGVLGVVAPRFFLIDDSYFAETRWLFLAVGFGFVITQIGLVYTGVVMGHQRYDRLNIGNIIRDLTRAGLVVVLFALGWKTLGGLAASVVAAHLAMFVYLRRAGHVLQPGLHVRPRWGEADARRQILGLSFWNGLVQIGNVVTFATPIFVVGKVLGVEAVPLYVVPFHMADRLRIIVAGMASTLAPMAAATLVSGDRDHFRALLTQGTRMAAMICLPIGALLLVLGEPFLRLYMGRVWSGAQCATAWSVYAVLMIAMFGRITQAPTLHVLIGGGRIKGLAIIQMVSAIATVTLTIVLATAGKLGVVGVALGMTIPLFLSHTIFLPAYAARQMGVSVWSYVRESYLGPLFCGVLVLGVALAARAMFFPQSWLVLIAEVLLSLGMGAVAAWYTCLDRSIRERIADKLGRLWLR